MSKSTTKVRFCLNASSLSKIIDKGPMYLPNLYKLLIKFRSKKLCITADLKEAFYSIGLSEKSVKLTNFLFRDLTQTNSEIKVMRSKRLIMG